MATIDDVKTAFLAINRTPIDDATAQAQATAITNGTTTLDAYISSLVTNALHTTEPAVAVYAVATGLTPTSAQLDALAPIDQAQFTSYTKQGVAIPDLGPFEALGHSFALGSTAAAFAAKFGSGSNQSFVDTTYTSIFGVGPSSGAESNLLSQITYFTNLYMSVGESASAAAIEARGAVLGQEVGYAFIDPTGKAESVLDDQTATFLTSIAHGSTSGYGAPLPAFSNPANVGVTIQLTGGTDNVSPTAANPAFQSTAKNDTIVGAVAGSFAATDNIDGGGGNDTLQAAFNTNITTTATTLVNVEKASLTNTDAAAHTIDFGNTTGLTSVGFVDNVSDASAINLASGVNLFETDTTPATDTPNVTFALKNATGVNDVANLTVDGVHNIPAHADIILDGFETVNVTASGAPSALVGAVNDGIRIIDANLQHLTINATAVVQVNLNGSTTLQDIVATGSSLIQTSLDGNNIVSYDASGTTGGFSDPGVSGNAVIFKGGSGDDTFGTITHTGAVVTAGAGNDTITFNLAATGTGQVTGGTGADAITMTGGKVTSFYTAQADSNNANFDTITGFTTASDKLDFTAMHITPTASSTLSIFTTSTATPIADGQAGLFGNGPNSEFSYNTTTGLLLVDLNHDGIFNVASDMVIKLVGAPAITIGDIVT